MNNGIFMYNDWVGLVYNSAANVNCAVVMGGEDVTDVEGPVDGQTLVTLVIVREVEEDANGVNRGKAAFRFFHPALIIHIYDLRRFTARSRSSLALLVGRWEALFAGLLPFFERVRFSVCSIVFWTAGAFFFFRMRSM